jgi:hypothetical protein
MRKQDRPALADPLWKLIEPWVVSAVKFGASSFMRSDIDIPLLCHGSRNVQGVRLSWRRDCFFAPCGAAEQELPPKFQYFRSRGVGQEAI